MAIVIEPEEFVRDALSGKLPADEAEGPLSFDPIQLQDQPVPEREWLVQDWIPMRTVTGLYGDGGVGKSLLGQQLMTACALGRGWIGLGVKPCRVLAVFCEDPLDELHRRQAEINTYYECDFGDLENMRWMPRMGRDNLLMTFNNGRGILMPFFDQVLAEAKGFGAEAILVDTVADTFGGNENDRGQVRQYVQAALGALAIEISGAVIAAAHPSRSGITTGTGDSGSTGWSNSFRSRAYLSVPQDENEPENPLARRLERKKANYASREETIELLWERGVFVPLTQPTGIFAAIEKRTCERVFLDLLREITRAKQYVSDSRQAGDRYAPYVFAGHPRRERYRYADFRRAMASLFAEGKIEMGEHRRSNRTSTACIVECTTTHKATD